MHQELSFNAIKWTIIHRYDYFWDDVQLCSPWSELTFEQQFSTYYSEDRLGKGARHRLTETHYWSFYSFGTRRRKFRKFPVATKLHRFFRKHYPAKALIMTDHQHECTIQDLKATTLHKQDPYDKEFTLLHVQDMPAHYINARTFPSHSTKTTLQLIRNGIYFC